MGRGKKTKQEGQLVKYEKKKKKINNNYMS